MKLNSQGARLLFAAMMAVAGLIALLLVYVLPPGYGSQACAFLLLWLIPAVLWAHTIAGEPVERLTSGAGLALLIPVILALVASYLPGPLTRHHAIIIALSALAAPLLVTATSLRGIRAWRWSWSRRESATLFVILGLAALVRTANLTYKEFQGDEGVVMMRAAQAILGDEMALLRHQKGPVEILLPLLPWDLVGSINELWARAAFTWAGWLVVAAVTVLGRRLYRRPTALVAGLTFAVGGFGVAFSRIVQYQSLVMLWTLLSLLHADRYQQRGRRSDLLLSAAFFAGALLAHYDAVLFAPAVAWLVLNKWRKRESGWRRHVVYSVLLGGAILALFYLPYIAGPTAAGTGSYLFRDRIGGHLFSWSLPQSWRMATFYNSTYYVVLLALLASAGVFLHELTKRHVAVVLALLVPLFFYTVVVADPRTHVYTIFPGLTLLAAAGAVAIWRRLSAGHRSLINIARYSMLALGIALLVASLLYVILLFVDVTPERQRTWSENRPLFFPTTWRDPPQYGLFGFPHQAGWRLAPLLVGDFPYSSNEEPEITNWYMAQAPRTHCPDFETFLVAANAQDALPYDEQRVVGMPLQGTITVNGVPSLHVYGTSAQEPARLEVTGQELWRKPQEVAGPLHTFDVVVDEDFGQKIRLLGYTLQSQTVEPGQTLTVTFYWQALSPIARNYQVFVHLYDGEMWAQHDGAPDCNVQPTSGWEPGQVVRDAHTLQLPSHVPASEIPLLVGVYDVVTLERLTVSGAGNDHIRLTEIHVQRD